MSRDECHIFCGYNFSSMLKAHKNSPKILAVFVYAMVKRANMFLVEKAEHFLFELSASLTGNDLYKRDFLLDRLLDNAIEFRINFIALIVNIVKVEF